MEGTVFDPLRKKHVAATPEEQVRQHFIQWLYTHRGYPLQLMASEYTIKLGRKNLRCDLVVFDKNLTPKIIVECKAPYVKLDNNVLAQIVNYNLILKVPHLIITNGECTFVCSYNPAVEKYEFVQDIPYHSSR